MSSPQSSTRAALLASGLAGALVALVSVVGSSAGAATAAPSCPVAVTVSLCANLVPGRFIAKVSPDGRKLELDGSATNAGSAGSPATTLQVTIGSDLLTPEPLPALAVKQTVPLQLVEAVPVDVRGTSQPVVVTLDPANAVAETNESDNDYRTKAFFPALPDLTLGQAAQQVEDGDTIVISVPVVNQGTADDTIRTTLTATGAGASNTATVPPIAKGTSDPVSVQLAVPATARHGAVDVTLTIDAADVLAEQDESNNTAELPPVTITPDLAIAEVTPSVRGRAVSLDVTVRNDGNTSAPGTQVYARAPGWQSKTKRLDTLAAGASTRTTLSLTAPQAARGTDVKVTLAVDQVPGDSPANDTKTVTVHIAAPPPPTPKPDLFIVSVHDPPHGGALTLNVDIGNAGRAGAGPTRVHASAQGWNAVVASVPPIGAGASTSVPLRMTVPASARGRRVRFTVNVDPVAGDPAGNNFRRVDVAVAKAAAARPDIAVSALTARRDGEDVVLDAAVSNVGDAPAHGVRLQLRASGWPPRTRTLATLRGGNATRVELVLAVPAAAAGTTADFRLRADPVRGETDLANNRTTTAFPVRSPPKPNRRWPYALAGVLGLLAITVGVAFTLHRRRLLVRLRWQEEANDERPETCEVPQSHVLKGEGKPKPALRSIERLGLSIRGDDGEEEQTSVDGAIVDVLNRALWSHRLHHRRRVHGLVEPLGEQLAAEIERRLAERNAGDGDVAVIAEIKGGKLEYEFTRSECARDGGECRWEERQKWKGEREHKVEEPVAAVRVPLVPRADRVRQLSAALVALVDRVDVPRRLRAPEAVPLPRE